MAAKVQDDIITEKDEKDNIRKAMKEENDLEK